MPDIFASLKSRLKAGDTAERCGFVTKRGRVIEVPNIHEEPEKGFHMDPKAVVKAMEKGVVATWHTHPLTDANLSGDDYSLFLNYDDMRHYIISDLAVRAYEVKDGLVVKVEL